MTSSQNDLEIKGSKAVTQILSNPGDCDDLRPVKEFPHWGILWNPVVVDAVRERGGRGVVVKLPGVGPDPH